MKRNLMKAFVAGGLAVLMTMGTLNTSIAQESGGGRLEGTWDVQVTRIDCQTGDPIATFSELNTFMAGGTMINSSGGIPQAFRTPAHGVWRHTAANNYVFRAKTFNFNAQNVPTGWTIVQHEATLDAKGNSYTSSAIGEIYDPNGVLLLTICATTVGTRFDL
jgi:hypothetical protein